VNGDGRPDLVYPVATADGLELRVLRRTAANTYRGVPPFAIATGGTMPQRRWLVLDADGDRRADLAAIGRGFVVTLLSRDDGQWKLAVSGVPGVDPGGLWRTGDADDNGRDDLVRVRGTPGGGTDAVQTLQSRPDGTWEGETHHVDDAVPASAAGWLSADVDGDGRLDLVRVTSMASVVHTLLRRADGWQATSAQPWTAPPAHLMRPHAGSDVMAWKALDLNRDGCVDLVHVSVTPSGDVYAAQLLSRGDGQWTFSGALTGNRALGGDAQNWLPADLDHDGRGDLVHASVTAGRVRVQSALGAGQGRWDARAPSEFEDLGEAYRDASLWSAIDVDGTGDSDLVQLAERAGTLRMRRLNSAVPRPHLWLITNGTGAETEISYGVSTGSAAAEERCRLPAGAVSSVVEGVIMRDAPSGASEREELRWACPRWSQRLRALVGWGETTVTHPATASRPAWSVRTRRQVSEEGIVQPVAEEVLADGAVIERSSWDYAALGDPPLRDLVEREQRATCDGDRCASTRTSYRYDDSGNVTRREVEVTGGAALAREELEYAGNSERFILSRLRSRTVRDADRVLSATVTCYDGDTTSDCRGELSRGLPTAVRAWDADRQRWVSQTTAYDAWGNVVAATDGRGNATTTEFDPGAHRYPVKSCNALGHCMLRREFDPVSGAPREVEDANGHMTRSAFDALGRLVATTGPGGRRTTVHYADDPELGSRIQQDALLPDGSGQRVVSYSDGLGREYLSSRGSVDGAIRQVRETRYADASGLPFRRDRWHDAGTEARWETTEYDAAGRVTAIRHPDGNAVRTSYGVGDGLLMLTQTDEAGRHRTAFHDGGGALKAVAEPSGDGVAMTRYAHDALGRTTEISDAHGNVTRFGWNTLGRLVSEHDGDRGTTTYRYDDDGNLVHRRNAAGQASSLRYDALGRLVAKRDETTGATSTWTYDEPGHGPSIGRLTSVRDESARGCPGRRSRAFEYDEAGNAIAETRCVTGMQLTFRTSFDALNRPHAVTYPDGETVRHRYDRAGRLTGLSGYAGGLRYDEEGRLTAATWANGTRGVWRFDDDRGWLTSQRIVGVNGRALFDARYRHEPSGLVAATESTTNRMDQRFSYDASARLTRVAGAYAQRLRYDDIGNMVSNSRVGLYTYGPGPHAVRRAGTVDYRYDAAGRLVWAGRRGRMLRRVGWNADGLPTVIEAAGRGRTTFRYDAGGERVERRSKRGVTRYFGPLAEWSPKTGLTKHVYAGAGLIASHAAGRKTWYALDRLGSPRALIDASGRVTRRSDFGAFGAASGSSASFGFAGQRPDPDTGLIYMHSRYYDPQLGRMISPDTIIPDPANPQALNRYSYAYNNPLAFVDPSGHAPEDVPTISAWDHMLSFRRRSELYEKQGVSGFTTVLRERLGNDLGSALRQADQQRQAFRELAQRHSWRPNPATEVRGSTASGASAGSSGEAGAAGPAGGGPPPGTRIEEDVVVTGNPETGITSWETTRREIFAPDPFFALAWNFAYGLNPHRLTEREMAAALIVAPYAAVALAPAVASLAATAASALNSASISAYTWLAIRAPGLVAAGWTAMRALSDIPDRRHRLSVTVFDAAGELVDDFSLVSGGTYGAFGHTEVAAARELWRSVGPGYTVVLQGFYPVCSYGLCHGSLSALARVTGADVVYYAHLLAYTSTRLYLGGVGFVRK
jgi:RHS repeat-associated protein